MRSPFAVIECDDQKRPNGGVRGWRLLSMSLFAIVEGCATAEGFTDLFQPWLCYISGILLVGWVSAGGGCLNRAIRLYFWVVSAAFYSAYHILMRTGVTPNVDVISELVIYPFLMTELMRFLASWFGIQWIRDLKKSREKE